VVEDAVTGVQAARDAGMRSLALPAPGWSGAEHLQAGALRVLSSMRELTPELIDELDLR
jgi:beta-phosphoglucomutase-like phosphatase (HAD superfamily)